MKHEKILEQLKKLPLEAQADLLADLEQLEELKNGVLQHSSELSLSLLVGRLRIGYDIND